jgi:hypothetical protein
MPKSGSRLRNVSKSIEKAQKRHERAPRLAKKIQKLLKTALNRLKRAL